MRVCVVGAGAIGGTLGARLALELIKSSAERSPRRLEDAASRVAAGRAMLAAGADAKQVLETYYDKAKQDELINFLKALK